MNAQASFPLRRVRRAAGCAVALAMLTLGVGGCNNARQGAVSGAAIGALGGLAIGSLTGSAGKGAAIGAIGGAIGGAILGDQNERRERDQSRASDW